VRSHFTIYVRSHFTIYVRSHFTIYVRSHFTIYVRSHFTIYVRSQFTIYVRSHFPIYVRSRFTIYVVIMRCFRRSKAITDIRTHVSRGKENGSSRFLPQDDTVSESSRLHPYKHLVLKHAFSEILLSN
jgi:hypothetical protein